MDFEAIVSKLKSQWPDVEAPSVEAGDRFVIVPAAKLLDSMKFLKEDAELLFDSLMTLNGVDTGKELWVVYPLHSMKHLHKLTVKVVLPRENPEVESVVGLWGMANFFEREAYDLYGIVFRNHPDLRRLLNPPDWVGWPMRKDYVYPTEYHGVPTLREGQYFADTIAKANAEREAKEKELLAKAAAGEQKRE
ncbi:MAG: NADH-quinone oxidoreductase subunit C [Planctomycetota bacterium]|nr:NADH-quinone oxidoreductase subunit C [Planctomycetota bacterium]